MLYEKILTVAGTSFRQDAIQQAKASSCTHAYLKHEPNNCFDPMAHQVFINGIHVGYVPKQEILGQWTPIVASIVSVAEPRTNQQLE